jgi:hypothetical protein
VHLPRLQKLAISLPLYKMGPSSRDVVSSVTSPHFQSTWSTPALSKLVVRNYTPQPMPGTHLTPSYHSTNSIMVGLFVSNHYLTWNVECLSSRTSIATFQFCCAVHRRRVSRVTRTGSCSHHHAQSFHQNFWYLFSSPLASPVSVPSSFM